MKIEKQKFYNCFLCRDILSNINEEFSHSLLEKYLEKAKNPNCWEEATIRSQTEPDSQNTFISCYFKNRDFVQMGYLTLIKMKEVNKNYCYSLAYVSNVFKKDRSSCFSIIQLEIPKTGLPIAQGDVLNLMHIVYIKSDLKQFQTIATLECNELVKLMMSPKNMVQLSPTTIKYTGKVSQTERNNSTD